MSRPRHNEILADDYFSVVAPVFHRIVFRSTSSGAGLGAGFFAVASLAFTLFVCFKASFVRNDAHSLIATGALSLARYCVSAVMETVPSLIVWVSVVFTWVCIDRTHTGLDILRVSQKLAGAVTRTFYGIEKRISSSQELRTAFDERNAAIRTLLPLPPIEGTIDSYQCELSGAPSRCKCVLQTSEHEEPGLCCSYRSDGVVWSAGLKDLSSL
jgi:hypothetical protein